MVLGGAALQAVGAGPMRWVNALSRLRALGLRAWEVLLVASGAVGGSFVRSKALEGPRGLNDCSVWALDCRSERL